MFPWAQLGKPRSYERLLALSLTTSATALAVPFSIGRVIDAISTRSNSLWMWVALFAVASVLTAIGAALYGLETSTTIGRRGARLADETFDSVQQADLEAVAEHASQGGLMTGIIMDTSNSASIIPSVALPAIANLFSLFGAVTLMISFNRDLGILALLPAPLLAIIARLYAPLLELHQKELMHCYDVRNTFLIDRLTPPGLLRSRCYNLSEYESGKLRDLNISVVSAIKKLSKRSAAMNALLTVTIASGSIFLLAVGARDVIAGQLSIGGLVAFLGYQSRVYQPVTMLASLSFSWATLITSFKRLGSMMRIKAERSSGLTPIPSEIEVRNVTVLRAQRPVATNISLSVRAGETVALIGQNGVGKSSLLNAIVGLCQVSEGAILFDGVPLDGIRLRFLRKQVVLVPQHDTLETGTVREFLTAGTRTTHDSNIHEMLRVVGLDLAIGARPLGLDSDLGSAGEKLSGGQRQRLILARALLRRPRFLLLDEATSNVDAWNEQPLMDNVRRALPEIGILAVVQRGCLTETADRVYRFDKNGTVFQDRSREETRLLPQFRLA